MNEVIMNAYRVNELQKEKGILNNNWDCGVLPDLNIADICTISDVWDGNGDIPDELGSYSYHISDSGFDGETNCDVWLTYYWKVLEEKNEPAETVIQITNIDLA